MLGKNEALIEGVVKIEKYSLLPGLGIEAARLLSSIVDIPRMSTLQALLSDLEAPRY